MYYTLSGSFCYTCIMVRAKNSSPKKAISRLIAAVFLMAGAGFLTYKVLVWQLGAPVKNQPAATSTVKTKPLTFSFTIQ